MNYDIKVGFSRVNITPPLGIRISGYYVERIADGVLDELYANALAISKNDKVFIMISVDMLGLRDNVLNKIRELVAKNLQICEDSLFIHSTHTHQGPVLAVDDTATEIEKIYTEFLCLKIAGACKLAIDDLCPAKAGYAISKAERVAFNRRYLMKDGSTKTNPGVNNPDIVKSIGLLDESVNIVRFARENKKDVVLINFADHPDTIGGNKISGDWPALTRKVFENAIENTLCITFNGTQGDINHVNVFPKDGDLNGMFNDFDDVTRGYAHAKHVANVVAASAMCVYEKVKFVDVEDIGSKITIIDVPTNKAKPEEMEEAYYIDKMHREGKDAELPYKGMMLTTMVAGAQRKIRLLSWPESLPLKFSTAYIGPIVFAGIPGEPFAGIGIELKKSKGWEMICPCCITNGYMGYFPLKDSYEEGGYEANTSQFKAGNAEIIIEEGKKILENLK